MKVPLVDVRAQLQSIFPEILSAVVGVIDSGKFILGSEIAAFEEEWANYVGAKYCVGVDNGTSALELALKAMGCCQGKKVVVPALTFFATAAAVCYTGAEPVFVDVDGNGLMADQGVFGDYIIPVMLYGQDFPRKREPQTNNGMPILWDACQAHGLKVKGTAAWSFYPSKNLGCLGDGGAITTDDGGIAHKVRMLRDYGQIEKYHHQCLGYNKRLDELQAAVLRVKLKHLDSWLGRRREIANRYIEGGLRSVAQENLKESVWHLFVIRHLNREQARKTLKAEGIETGIHYPLPLHLQPVFRGLGYREGDFPVAERLAQEVLSLPIYPEMTDEQIDYVIEKVRKI